MTTKVTIEAHCGPGNEVSVMKNTPRTMHDKGFSESFRIQDGEVWTGYIYGSTSILAVEVPKIPTVHTIEEK